MSTGPAHAMRGFAWRLAPLHAMAEWARDRAALELSQALRDEQAALTVSEDLARQYRDQSGFVCESVAQMFDRALHAQRFTYLTHLHLQCIAAEEGHTRRREQVAHCRAQCSDQMRDVEGLQRARALALRSHLVSVRSVDAAEADRAWLARGVGTFE